jgi:putative ABC transport system ATP-binding protein
VPEELFGKPLIVVTDVSKVYRPGQESSVALRRANLSINEGEFVAIIGPSGSGKSTLLNLIAGLDKPTSGSVYVQGVEVSALDEERLACWRGRAVGVVFQFFQLLPTLTALENVMLPMELAGRFRGERCQQALERLASVGLAELADHLPSELSGGEQQRVAIARALANDPPLLLADEPTGNLDWATGERIMELLQELDACGKTVVLVTHERALAAGARRVVEMRDGEIVAAGPP